MKHTILSKLSLFEHTGNIEKDMTTFLTLHGFYKTALHCSDVGKMASVVANQFGENKDLARLGGLLHDISAIFPNERRIAVAKSLEIPILPEELQFPAIIHQKISAVMATELFNIYDLSVLSAIGCHTTLKKKSSRLDKVLFVADKIRWDGSGNPPYFEQITKKLKKSLDEAVFFYLDYMIKRSNSLPVIHPWLREAHKELGLSLKH